MAQQVNEILLVKNGEIALKGANRSTFEDILIKNIKRRLRGTGEYKVRKAQSTICIEPVGVCDIDTATQRLSKVFGIAAYSRAALCKKDFDDICRTARAYLEPVLRTAKTFKVEARRSDKSFSMRSPEICNELGAYLLGAFENLRVDVHHPDVVVMVEVRDFAAYVHSQALPGAGGMPTSCAGKAALLVSGGIDSPVACYMMAKRGLEIVAVHFFSPPYTSERAKLKVLDLLKKLSVYCGRIKIVIVPFTEIQEQIRAQCDEDLFTLIMRRFMMRISEQVALQNDCHALITGESVGQVASQTLLALGCTDAVCTMPVFRPVIGMDKEEIIQIARKIDTFETSIQPFEDCCTVFTPRHPRTRPKINVIEHQEEKLDIQALVDRALAGIEIIEVTQSITL